MTDDFDQRLKSAIQRGQLRGKQSEEASRATQLSEEEFKRLHTQYRLSLSDRIEKAIDRVAQHFPGFRTEMLYGEVGWGAACYRDDLTLSAGRRSNLFSRMEMTIRPMNEYHLLDLRGKATVANKEYFNRNHFVPLPEVNEAEFARLIDTWAIEYAEYFASRR
ncbi:MAG: hypothetical protein EHM77_06065 [Planctomycetaceae bacterium]|jgi:hypothetical protein|nr:MAG: hypothetical protein EHM77_06065 [Planctomycetaceae bacterium]